MTTVAETIADQLHAANVRTVFGMPGGEVVEVLDALRRRGIRFELAHHETSAVFMADAVARLTGTPGVVLTTLGPGASNAVAGVAHAHLDRSPVLLITAQKPDDLLPDYTHQVLDLHALYAPITKRSTKLTAENAARVVPEVLDLARRGRPGPVHLQVSNEEAARAASLPSEPSSKAMAAPENLDETDGEDAIRQAQQILSRAQRPLILCGLGLEPEGPYAALRALAESLDAPVVVTPKAKGALSAPHPTGTRQPHPLSAGAIGLTPTDPIYEIVDEADCIVAVGFDVVELVKPWQHPAPLIWIAAHANADPVLPAEVEFVGSMEPVLRQLARTERKAVADWGAARVDAFRARLDQRPLPVPADGLLLPQTVLRLLRQNAAPETPLAVDVGSHKIFASLEWEALHPNRFLVSNGLSCMGFALPAAIGASLARDGGPALCLIGDGGLAMCLGELGVLARLELPVVVVVLVDGAIDLIRSHQMRRGKPVHGTEFPPPDFAAIAAAHGIHGVRVDGEAALDEALRTAFASGAPTLVEVPIDPIGYPTTPSGR